MLASDELIEAMNRQVGNEMGASMQYITIASHFAGEALEELSNFFYVQAEEERDHAMKFVRFIVDAGGRVKIPEIPAPKAQFGSAEEAVELALRHEEQVTRQIHGLVEIAQGESNYAAQRFLDWFVEEQFEEEATMGDLLQTVRRAGPDDLLLVEEALARRGHPEENGEG